MQRTSKLPTPPAVAHASHKDMGRTRVTVTTLFSVIKMAGVEKPNLLLLANAASLFLDWHSIWTEKFHLLIKKKLSPSPYVNSQHI